MLPVTETALPGIDLSIPQVIERDAEPYLAFCAAGAMRDLPQFAPPLLPKLHAWMAGRGMAPGPTLFRYRSFSHDGGVELDVGALTVGKLTGGEQAGSPQTDSEEVVAGELPAGRYAFATYAGPYDRLYDAFCMLNGWFRARGLSAVENASGSGHAPGGQFEIYRVGPSDTDDPVRYRTDLFILLI